MARTVVEVVHQLLFQEFKDAHTHVDESVQQDPFLVHVECGEPIVKDNAVFEEWVGDQLAPSVLLTQSYEFNVLTFS